MGESFGGPHASHADPPDPRDNPYLQPLYPQLYPPLGYAADGTPMFAPGQSTRSAGAAQRSAPESPTGHGVGHSRGMGSPDALTPDALTPDSPTPDSETPTPRPRLGRPLALVAVAVLVLLGAALMLSMRTESDESTVADPTFAPTLTALPPTEEPTRIPPLPGDDQPEPTMPGRAPSASIPSAGKSVVYEVSLSDSGSIIYVDDTGLRTAVGSPSRWRITFTGVDNPLRILVISAVGSASCQISVAGQVVASDGITGDSSRRTVSCRA